MNPDEVREEMLRDFVGARYACAVVRIQDDESPTHYENRVKKAGMLCREESFQFFLGLNSEDEAAAKMCKICGIESRTELYGNANAQVVFDRLVNEYEKQKVTDDPF